MLRETLVSHDMIRYDVVQAGRVLHVRAPFGSVRMDRSLDLVGVYQYPWDTRKPRAQLLEARSKLRKRLDVMLQRLPRRNLLFVCGDYNVQLPAKDRHVGTGILIKDPSSQQATDSQELLNLVVSHDLCAVNTWRGPKQMAYTYSMGKARTLIDYVFVRVRDADSIAKGCLPLTSFPIADWRLDGKHRAMIGSLAATWKVRPTNKPQPQYNKEAMLEAYSKDPTLAEVSSAFVGLMEQHRCTADKISDCLLQACCRVYPAVRAKCTEDRMSLVRGPIATMWATWRTLHATRGASLRSVLQIWRLRVRFRIQKKAVEKASREQRKLRVHTLLEQAETDDKAHNTRGLYSTVRKLAPKQRYKPLQVKMEKGICLSCREETAELKRFFGEVFCDKETVIVQPWMEPYCPALDTLQRALQKLPAHKAVPGICAPSMVWKACATIVAPFSACCLCRYGIFTHTDGPAPLEGWMDGACTESG